MKNSFISSVFKWLFIGLLLTFASAYYTSTSMSLITFLFVNKLYFLVYIAQIVIAIVLSARLLNMKRNTAIILYLIYTVLTGMTFASIFLMFEISSIIFIFLATSLVFGVFAFIGKVTKLDLTRFGTYLFMGLVAVIILELINIFMLNNTLNMISCIISLLVFIGFIAYDMQKISRLYSRIGNDNLAIFGAFQLYLDFINVFLDLLSLFGRERK